MTIVSKNVRTLIATESSSREIHLVHKTYQEAAKVACALQLGYQCVLVKLFLSNESEHERGSSKKRASLETSVIDTLNSKDHYDYIKNKLKKWDDTYLLAEKEITM